VTQAPNVSEYPPRPLIMCPTHQLTIIAMIHMILNTNEYMLMMISTPMNSVMINDLSALCLYRVE
jgi:hypothetical protein